MIKLIRGYWRRIPADETNWQCEYGPDKWDLSCKTCRQSPDLSSRSHQKNRAHWRNDDNWLCSFHYDMLAGDVPDIFGDMPKPPILEFVSAAEFASAFDDK